MSPTSALSRPSSSFPTKTTRCSSHLLMDAGRRFLSLPRPFGGFEGRRERERRPLPHIIIIIIIIAAVVVSSRCNLGRPVIFRDFPTGSAAPN